MSDRLDRGMQWQTIKNALYQIYDTCEFEKFVTLYHALQVVII